MMPSMTGSHDWSETFVPRSAQHGAVLIVCALTIALACVIGRVLLARDLRAGAKVPRAGHERRWRHALAWSIVVTQGFILVRRLTPENFDLDESLPLHLCRLGVWIAAWLLFTLDTRARALTLFWGIGLSMQIFFTPFLGEGHGSIVFWIYWLNHVQIVGAGVYDITVLGYRPSRRDLRLASSLGVGYVLVVAGINAALGTNYSYLGAGEHEGASVVDVMGAYPWRMIWMTIGALAIFALIFGVSRSALFVRTRMLNKPPPRRIDRSGVVDTGA